MPRTEALVTPSVMQWARKQAKLSIIEAAKKINRPPEDIQSWEDGTLRPSIAQARNASKVYKQPLAVFYLPDPPKGFGTLRDFRNLPNTRSKEYSPALSLLIRVTKYRQEWIRGYFLEQGYERLPFVGSADLNDDHRKVAKDILRVIDITPEKQKKCKTRQKALRMWLDNVEKSRIFVSRQSNIELEEVRGFLLSDDISPFIFVNSGDSKAAQIFTIAHELAHLWLGFSGISNSKQRGQPVDDDNQKIEVFCNKVAAEAVLENKLFEKEWEKTNIDRSIFERIEKVSSTLNVSEEVIARRLLDLETITQNTYREFRIFYQERWHEIKEMERRKYRVSKSGPTYYITTAPKIGYSFTNTIISGYASNSISGRDASALLNVKINNFHKLGEASGIFPKTEGKSGN